MFNLPITCIGGVPHVVDEDTFYNRYFIPARSLIRTNFSLPRYVHKHNTYLLMWYVEKDLPLPLYSYARNINKKGFSSSPRSAQKGWWQSQPLCLYSTNPSWSSWSCRETNYANLTNTNTIGLYRSWKRLRIPKEPIYWCNNRGKYLIARDTQEWAWVKYTLLLLYIFDEGKEGNSISQTRIARSYYKVLVVSKYHVYNTKLASDN